MSPDSLLFARSDFPLPSGVMRLRRNRFTNESGWFFAVADGGEPHFRPVDSSQFAALGAARTPAEALDVIEGRAGTRPGGGRAGTDAVTTHPNGSPASHEAVGLMDASGVAAPVRLPFAGSASSDRPGGAGRRPGPVVTP